MVWWILKAIVARMLFQQFIALLKGFNHANEFFLPSNCFLRQYFFKSFIWKTRIWKKNGIFIVQFDCRIQFKSISEFSLWKLLKKTNFDAKIFFPSSFIWRIFFRWENKCEAPNVKSFSCNAFWWGVWILTQFFCGVNPIVITVQACWPLKQTTKEFWIGHFPSNFFFHFYCLDLLILRN